MPKYQYVAQFSVEADNYEDARWLMDQFLGRSDISVTVDDFECVGDDDDEEVE